jgi:hypothetical protein
VAQYSPRRDALRNHLAASRRSLDRAVILAVALQDEGMAGELTMMQAELTACIVCVDHLQRYRPGDRQLQLGQCEDVPRDDYVDECRPGVVDLERLA